MSEKIGVKEAAKILGLSKKTVYSRLRSGQIPAEKVETKHGLKWVIDKEQLKEQATHEKEVVEVKEINELVSKEDLMNDLIEAINSQNETVINEAMNSINDTIKQQNEAIEDLSEQVNKLQQQQNRSILDKIKDFFNQDKTTK